MASYGLTDEVRALRECMKRFLNEERAGRRNFSGGQQAHSLIAEEWPAACGNRTAGRIQPLALGTLLTIDTLPTSPVTFSDAHSATKRAVPILRQ